MFKIISEFIDPSITKIFALILMALNFIFTTKEEIIIVDLFLNYYCQVAGVKNHLLDPTKVGSKTQQKFLNLWI